MAKVENKKKLDSKTEYHKIFHNFTYFHAMNTLDWLNWPKTAFWTCLKRITLLWKEINMSQYTVHKLSTSRFFPYCTGKLRKEEQDLVNRIS